MDGRNEKKIDLVFVGFPQRGPSDQIAFLHGLGLELWLPLHIYFFCFASEDKKDFLTDDECLHACSCESIFGPWHSESRYPRFIVNETKVC